MQRIDQILAPVDAALAEQYPGDRTGRQPVHSVYVPADRGGADTVEQWGAQASALLADHGDALTGVDPDVVARRLAAAPIQDLRFDFEDGYGGADDAAQDADARRIGAVLAAFGPSRPESSAPPRWSRSPLRSLQVSAETTTPLRAAAPTRFGIRARGLEPEERRRGIRTLELVLDAAGGVSDGFVFTVPKIRSADQVPALLVLCEAFEQAHGLPEGTLGFELQIESPHIVLGADGTAGIARAIRAARGRCSALHFGTYDYTAALGIAPRFQSLAHPAADHAKAVMMLAAAQAGVWVSDGSTQVLPQGSPDDVRSALALHQGLVTRSLQAGIYQGWDLHPGHLVSRWAATIAFYREAMPIAAQRIDAYCRRDASGTAADEPATAQTLAGLLVRGLACEAFTEAEYRVHAPEAAAEVLDALVHRRPLPA
ncbi:MAG: aldolase [Gordonia sp. (in: high G+C Gram-positive bacteria)]|uniref:DUF6986 family protein n=1 Tax=Gordonia sp. (in: high G+C Gram-positive bacteria) TaxID=84139 RepID=UPI0039E64938